MFFRWTHQRWIQPIGKWTPVLLGCMHYHHLPHNVQICQQPMGNHPSDFCIFIHNQFFNFPLSAPQHKKSEAYVTAVSWFYGPMYLTSDVFYTPRHSYFCNNLLPSWPLTDSGTYIGLNPHGKTSASFVLYSPVTLYIFMIMVITLGLPHCMMWWWR